MGSRRSPPKEDPEPGRTPTRTSEDCRAHPAASILAGTRRSPAVTFLKNATLLTMGWLHVPKPTDPPRGAEDDAQRIAGLDLWTLELLLHNSKPWRLCELGDAASCAMLFRFLQRSASSPLSSMIGQRLRPRQFHSQKARRPPGEAHERPSYCNHVRKKKMQRRFSFYLARLTISPPSTPRPATSLATEENGQVGRTCDGQSAPEMAPSTLLGHKATKSASQ